MTDNIPLTPHDSSLPGCYTPDEGRLQQEKLTDIVTALSQKVEGLESDPKKTKKLYAIDFKKLINRLKSLEDKLKFHKSKSKRRRLTLVTSKDKVDLVAEDPSKQGGVLKTVIEIRKSVAKDKGKAKIDETKSPRKMKQREQAQIRRDEKKVKRVVNNIYHEASLEFCTCHQRKKFFAQQRAEAKRNKPMTPTLQKDYMSNYIKNQEGGYSIKQLKSLSFEQVKDIFETTMRRVQSFVPMVSELEIGEASGSGEEQSAEKEKELSEEELHKLLVMVLVEELVIQPLQKFDKDDLVKLWDLVKERFSTTEPIDDKENELWVELKRLFEPNNDDILWKLQRYMHDPLVWRLYDLCGVHHVSSVRGHDIFVLVEKEYPLTKETLGLMMVARLLVKQ
ncbi:hypothetical protein Tco_0975145 [Tanacetum coccineum]|uniref:Uncharacterized protein n=1 Tax=Tanacetum coccineum TaxID=301880 RepID=A0ABQ5EDL1_9ASTR